MKCKLNAMETEDIAACRQSLNELDEARTFVQNTGDSVEH